MSKQNQNGSDDLLAKSMRKIFHDVFESGESVDAKADSREKLSERENASKVNT